MTSFTSSSSESDGEFIARLYGEFKYIMLSTAKKYVDSPEDREDIVQESVVKLLDKASLLRGKEPPALAAYVVYTVRNTAINRLRRASVEKAHFEELDGDTDPEADTIPLDELMALRELKIHLDRLLSLLSEDDRTLLIGKYILEYNDAELARELGCKSSSVRMKLTRARRRALKIIARDEVLRRDEA